MSRAVSHVRVLWACAGLLAVFAFPPNARADDFASQLTAGIHAVQTFEYGQDPAALQAFESVVLRSSADHDKRAQAEVSLLAALDSSTAAGSDFICRLLRTVATERAIPKLEALLIDPALSHKARYALERIESHDASAALHRALGKTDGKLQAGILGTLGRRGYEKAVPDARKHLHSTDPVLSSAAASALGQIGGEDAIAALQPARRDAAPALQRTIDDALLSCAERLLASGDRAAAAKIYAEFDADGRPVHHRIAALRGLVAAGAGDATDRVLHAIRGHDPQLRATAITFSRDLEGENATLALVAVLPTLDVTSQEFLIASLRERRHPTAAFAILTATRSEHEKVRVAAYQALGSATETSVVDLLIEAAHSGSEHEQRAARTSLLQLRTEGINSKLADGIETLAPPHQIERLRALAGRQARQAFGQALALAWHDNADVRAAAFGALGNLGTGSQLPSLVALTVSPRTAADRDGIQDAIQRIWRRVPEAARRAAPLIAALPATSGEAKATLLGLLAKTGTPEAALAVRRAVGDTDPRVRGAAVHALAHWPNTTPAKDLLTIAATLSERKYKALAMNGYIRMASHSEDASGMYRRAMELAKGRTNTQLVLEGLATVTSDETLTLAEGYLDNTDTAVKATAARSVVRIANGLRDKDPPRVKSALARALKEVNDDSVRREAQEVLNHFEQYEGYVLEWVVSGPYRERGKDSYAIYDMKFLPEQPDAQNVPWKTLRRGVGSWAIDLEKGVANLNHVAAYVKTRVHSPSTQSARLELGSDDAIKAWMNGKLVHAKHTKRGLQARNDIVPVQLKEGWNEVFLKVVDHGGGWQFCCRLRKADGTALEGLTVKRR